MPSHKTKIELDNEQVMVLESAKNKETFSYFSVKEESRDHYDNHVGFLSHVENDFSNGDQTWNENVDVETVFPHIFHEASNCPNDQIIHSSYVGQPIYDEYSGDEESNYELEVNNEEFEGSFIIINSDYYKPEDLVSLNTKHNDQLSFGQLEMEISKGNPQLSDLQTRKLRQP